MSPVSSYLIFLLNKAPHPNLRQSLECGSPLPPSSAMSSNSSKDRCHQAPRSLLPLIRRAIRTRPGSPDTSSRSQTGFRTLPMFNLRRSNSHCILELQDELRCPFLTADLAGYGGYRTKKRQKGCRSPRPGGRLSVRGVRGRSLPLEYARSPTRRRLTGARMVQLRSPAGCVNDAVSSLDPPTCERETGIRK